MRETGQTLGKIRILIEFWPHSDPIPFLFQSIPNLVQYLITFCIILHVQFILRCKWFIWRVWDPPWEKIPNAQTLPGWGMVTDSCDVVMWLTNILFVACVAGHMTFNWRSCDTIVMWTAVHQACMWQEDHIACSLMTWTLHEKTNCCTTSLLQVCLWLWQYPLRTHEHRA